jgi:hypothetical protein
MARVNHNANYLYDVDGETVWEKLRTIRGMLNERRMSYKISFLNYEENEKKYQEDTSSFEYKKWLINKEFQKELLIDCNNEIQFLETFESFLAKEAEKTRILGKTDDEMYEINFFHEMEVRLVRRAQAQIISNGRLSDELVMRLMKNKNALNICIQLGFITDKVVELVEHKLLPSYSAHSNLFLNDNSNEPIKNELPQIEDNSCQ